MELSFSLQSFDIWTKKRTKWNLRGSIIFLPQHDATKHSSKCKMSKWLIQNRQSLRILLIKCIFLFAENLSSPTCGKLEIIWAQNLKRLKLHTLQLSPKIFCAIAAHKVLQMFYFLCSLKCVPVSSAARALKLLEMTCFLSWISSIVAVWVTASSFQIQICPRWAKAGGNVALRIVTRILVVVL